MTADTAETPLRNGKVRLLSIDDLDGRTMAAKKARSLVEQFQVDCGGGDHLSAGCRQLIQRAAVIGALCEAHEAAWLAGKQVAIQDWLAACNNQRRLIRDLGIERTRTARTIASNSETGEYAAYLDCLREDDTPGTAP